MIYKKRDWYCVGKKKFKTLAEAEEFATEGVVSIEEPENVAPEPVDFDFDVD